MGGFPSLNGIVSLQKNLYATRQNPQSNVKYVLMATSSSTTFGGPPKGDFCSQKLLRGASPELFPAGEGLSHR